MFNELDQREKSISNFGIFVCIICFVTNLTQLPSFVDVGITSKLAMLIWLLFAIVCILIDHTIFLSGIKGILGMVLFFFLYYFIAGFFNSAYYSSALPRAIFLSIFVLIVGIMTGRYLNENDIELCFTAYILSGIIVCFNIFTKYIYGNNFTSRIYLYESKNSVSQILLTCWLLILFMKFSNHKRIGLVKTVLYCLAFVFLTYVMVALKSRATIIGMPIILLWCLMHSRMNNKAKNIALVLILIVTFLLIFNQNIYNILVNDVLMGGRDSTNIYDLSSGRSDEWKNFVNDMAGNWLFGQGRCKRESFILTSLLEFGLIGGIPLLVISIIPFMWGNRNLKNSNYYLPFTAISLVYWVNGIFEQLAPFGPGVKCYFLWFLFGVFASKKTLGDYEIGGDKDYD